MTSCLGCGTQNSVKVLCMLLCATQYHNKLLPLVTLSWLWRLYVFPPLQRVLWVKSPLFRRERTPVTQDPGPGPTMWSEKPQLTSIVLLCTSRGGCRCICASCMSLAACAAAPFERLELVRLYPLSEPHQCAIVDQISRLRTLLIGMAPFSTGLRAKVKEMWLSCDYLPRYHPISAGNS